VSASHLFIRCSDSQWGSRNPIYAQRHESNYAGFWGSRFTRYKPQLYLLELYSCSVKSELATASLFKLSILLITKMKLPDLASPICIVYFIFALGFIKPIAATCCPCNIYGTCGDTAGCTVWECCSYGPW
jgi:hypothetical protein